MSEPRKVLEIDKVTREVVGEYKSCNHAGMFIPFHFSTIHYYCKHRTLPPGDTYFRFKEEFDPNERFEKKLKHKPIMATCGNRARAFHDNVEAANAAGVTVETMNCYVCNEKTVKGIKWRPLLTKWPDSVKDGSAWAK